jgi:alpha-glucosidase (family GH31 glycosyl hydrolase)
MAGLDPLWSLNHYHYLDNAKEKENPLILSRYAGVGSHRYPLGFSGDTEITWATLDYLPYFTATASNVGYTWWSHDIGGHHRGEKEDELFVRHVQFGVLSPINRLHCSNWETLSKEPWYFLNGAGEIAVHAFLQERIAFTEIAETMKAVLEKTERMQTASYEILKETDARARALAREIIGK